MQNQKYFSLVVRSGVTATCQMHHQFHGMWCIPLQSPILFGRHHHHHYARTCSFFANLPRYHLIFSQTHFCYRTSQWWNGLHNDENFTVAINDSLSFFCFHCSIIFVICLKVVAFVFMCFFLQLCPCICCVSMC